MGLLNIIINLWKPHCWSGRMLVARPHHQLKNSCRWFKYRKGTQMVAIMKDWWQYHYEDTHAPRTCTLSVLWGSIEIDAGSRNQPSQHKCALQWSAAARSRCRWHTVWEYWQAGQLTQATSPHSNTTNQQTEYMRHRRSLGEHLRDKKEWALSCY